MGNRYGRNQKRQHRERIAALEKMHEIDRALLGKVSADLTSLRDEVEEWDEEIRRLLGNHSALRRDTPEIVSSNPIREMPLREPIQSLYGSDAAHITMAMPTRERMRRFIFTIRKDDLRMQRLIRFMEADGAGGVAYSISETALRQGFGRREIAYMAHEIASNLVDYWNGQRDKKRTSA